MDPDEDIVDQLFNQLEEDEALYSANTMAGGNSWIHGARSTPKLQLETLDFWRHRRDGLLLDGFDRQLLEEVEQVEPTLERHGVPRLTTSSKLGGIPEDLVYHPKPIKALDLSHLAYSPTKKGITPRGWNASKSSSHSSFRREICTQKEFHRANSGSNPSNKKLAAPQSALSLGHAPPIVHGIKLVPVNQLPDRLRPLFPFEFFNAVQSKMFDTVYNSNDNVVLSSPTGSGKTIVLELAICRVIEKMAQGTYKIVYQAPTKALCAERKRDWEKKFALLGLTCTELTGDTAQSQILHVKDSDIIITTPEKWDSMTRRWEDHKRLLQMVKAFLVDEIHTLKDSRGATLEVVISRMKSLGIEVRFVALSATIPNSSDIANWLGKNNTYPNEPAFEVRFGEEFRPVKLQKYVFGYPASGNEFMFDKSLDKQYVLNLSGVESVANAESSLIDIIKQHSAKKAIMIFCMTRTICATTAKFLVEAQSKGTHLWPMPSKTFSFKNKDLQATALIGVGFHHAGIDHDDRILLERLYIEGVISVICCTSTLAVGINMPAYLVILKNTVTFGDQRASESRVREYDDLEIMQMLGRAGRPQFDSSGVAVIMTRRESQKKYEMMISGTDPVESCLHLNLVEHLNAEIGMGTITDVSSGMLWLKSTFLWNRMQSNPSHYKLQGQTVIMNIDQKLEEICEKDINALEMEGLIEVKDGLIKSTAYGHAMARSYVNFETMKKLLHLKENADISEILTTISEASEFKDLRIRHNERSLYKEVNKNPALRYPIKGIDVSSAGHKVNLLLQFELGSLEIPPGDVHQKQSMSMSGEKNFVFQHAPRIARCLVDCRIESGDAITLRNALDLSRSINARCWEHTPAQLKQLDGIGPAIMRKFIASNVQSIEELAKLEPHRIEMIASRHPPFGSHVLREAQNIPQFTISLREVDRSAHKKKPIKLIYEAVICLSNQSKIRSFKGKSMVATFLGECDGQILDFRRLPVYKLQDTTAFRFFASMSRVGQEINCHIACEDIVGTVKTIKDHPDIDPSLFPNTSSPLQHMQGGAQIYVEPGREKQINDRKATSRRLTGTIEGTNKGKVEKADTPLRRLFSSFPQEETQAKEDEFDDPEFLAAVNDLDFSHIENLYNEARDEVGKSLPLISKSICKNWRANGTGEEEGGDVALQLPNGKWKCKHKCGDKMRCKHLCCREGLDKPPKAAKKVVSGHMEPYLKALRPELNTSRERTDFPLEPEPKGPQTQYHKPKARYSELPSATQGGEVEIIDLAKDEMTFGPSTEIARSLHTLNNLHSRIVAKKSATTLKKTVSPMSHEVFKSRIDEKGPLKGEFLVPGLPSLPLHIDNRGGEIESSQLPFTDPANCTENYDIDSALVADNVSLVLKADFPTIGDINGAACIATDKGKRKAEQLLSCDNDDLVGADDPDGRPQEADSKKSGMYNAMTSSNFGETSKRQKLNTFAKAFDNLSDREVYEENDEMDETFLHINSPSLNIGYSTEPIIIIDSSAPPVMPGPDDEQQASKARTETGAERLAGMSKQLLDFLSDCVDFE